MTYKFLKYTVSDITEDPVFNDKEFSLYGDPSLFDGPELYYVKKYRYALANPEKDKNNKASKARGFILNLIAVESKL